MRFTVLGTPIPQGSTKAFNRKGGGHPIVTADNPATKPWRRLVAAAAMQAGVPMVSPETPMAVGVVFCFERPASAKKRRYPTVRPDLDKLVRSCLDALTGIAWVDDAQVVALNVSKAYSSPARAEIEVYPL